MKVQQYRRVHVSFWTGDTMGGASATTKLVALYLVTGPLSNALGLSVIPAGSIANHCGLTVAEVDAALADLVRREFIRRDDSTCVTLVLRAHAYQLDVRHRTNENVTLHVQAILNQYAWHAFTVEARRLWDEWRATPSLVQDKALSQTSACPGLIATSDYLPATERETRAPEAAPSVTRVRRAQPTGTLMPIPADWSPSPELLAAIQMAGGRAPTAEDVERFRLSAAEKGKAVADVEASFRLWMNRERAYDARARARDAQRAPQRNDPARVPESYAGPEHPSIALARQTKGQPRATPEQFAEAEAMLRTIPGPSVALSGPRKAEHTGDGTTHAVMFLDAPARRPGAKAKDTG